LFLIPSKPQPKKMAHRFTQIFYDYILKGVPPALGPQASRPPHPQRKLNRKNAKSAKKENFLPPAYTFIKITAHKSLKQPCLKANYFYTFFTADSADDADKKPPAKNPPHPRYPRLYLFSNRNVRNDF